MFLLNQPLKAILFNNTHLILFLIKCLKQIIRSINITSELVLETQFECQIWYDKAIDTYSDQIDYQAIYFLFEIV